jgi:hypothetical protein
MDAPSGDPVSWLVVGPWLARIEVNHPLKTVQKNHERAKNENTKSKDHTFDDPPRLSLQSCKLGRSTIYVAVAEGLTSKAIFAKRAIPFANSPSLQICPAATTLLGIALPPTSVVRGRAQENVRSRAQGKSPLFFVLSSFVLS